MLLKEIHMSSARDPYVSEKVPERLDVVMEAQGLGFEAERETELAQPVAQIHVIDPPIFLEGFVPAVQFDQILFAVRKIAVQEVEIGGLVPLGRTPAEDGASKVRGLGQEFFRRIRVGLKRTKNHQTIRSLVSLHM